MGHVVHVHVHVHVHVQRMYPMSRLQRIFLYTVAYIRHVQYSIQKYIMYAHVADTQSHPIDSDKGCRGPHSCYM